MSAHPQIAPCLKTRIKGERGQVIVLICLAMIAIMGLVGMVADVGFLQQQRNRMQTAADSAALAGAQEISYGDTVTAAKADATSNGFTNGQSNVTVAINNPPTGGPNVGNSGYVEAIVTKAEPTYFLQVLGFTTVSVSARAVATAGNSPNCVYVMDPSAPSAMLVNGNVTIQSGCGLLIDSTSSSGLSINGNVTITATSIGVTGGYSSNGNVTLTPTPKTGIVGATDPLAYVQPPSVGACNHSSFVLNGIIGSSGSPYQLYAGVYCGGITVNGNSWLMFNPGTYVLAGGGLQINGNSVMTGSGVTFYNTTGSGGYQPIVINGNSTSNFSAPTAGALAGILFFQDRAISSGTGSTINGNASSTFDGAMYFPTTSVTYNGNSSRSGYSLVVADKFTTNGNSTVGTNYSSLTNGSPIKAPVPSE
jgi:Putative Flp pilus-assembly TadE/G-like